MKKICIICPSDDELAPFLAELKDYTQMEKSGLTIYDGTIRNIPVLLLYCGVCKVNAAIAAQLVADTCDVAAIINAGVAGGMDTQLKIFDTVVSTECCYHDVTEDILTEFHPWMKTIWFHSDEKLLNAAHAVAAGKASSDSSVYFGRTVTGESFITDDGREDINRRFAPLSVDMETTAVAHVCYVNKIPFIAVRTITDTADHSGIDTFHENCPKAASIAKDFVCELISRI